MDPCGASIPTRVAKPTSELSDQMNFAMDCISKRSLRLDVFAGEVVTTCWVSPIATVTALSIRLAQSHQIPLGYEAEEFRRDGRLLPAYASDLTLAELGIRDGDVLVFTPARKPAPFELSIRAYDRHMRQARATWRRVVAQRRRMQRDRAESRG